MRDTTDFVQSWAFALDVLTSPASQAIALCGGLAFLAAALLTPIVGRLARRAEWVAYPSGDRWHDGRSVALMGGVAIAAAVGLAVLLTGEAQAIQVPVWTAALLLFGVGITDDRRGLSPRVKLLVQITAAALTLYGGLVFWESGPFWLSGPLTFLWVIGVTNAFNLIDGMDGLAGGIAVIAAATLAVIAAIEGLPGWAGVAAAVAGAAGGFLLYNSYPAEIFMGDAGSLFLGYLLGVIAIGVQGGGTLAAARPGAALVPMVVLAVPLFDVAFVTVMRVSNGRSISQGGTDHSMHRLAFMGLSERQTVLLLHGVSAVLGGVALVLYTQAVMLFMALLLAAASALIVLGGYIATADVYPSRNGDRVNELLNDEPSSSAFSVRLGAVMQAFFGIEWKRAGGLFADMLVVLSAFVMAHALRFPDGMPASYQTVMLEVLPLVAVGKVAVFYAMGIYHRLWPRAGTAEMVQLVKAVVCTSALAFLGIHAVYPATVVSASALVIDMMLTVAGVGATRFGFRAIRQFILHKQRSGQRVIISGVGAEGLLTLRFLDMPRAGEPSFHVVGFLDRERRLHDRYVKGLPVLGDPNELEAVCEQHDIDGVIVNTVAHSEREIQALQKRCQDIGRDYYRVTLDLQQLAPERADAEDAVNGVAKESADSSEEPSRVRVPLASN